MASNTLALALLDDVNLPLASLTDTRVVRHENVGPGRLLAKVYTAAGKRLEKTANKTAHKIGLGPLAVTDRIILSLGSHTEETAKMLNHLYSSSTKDKPPGVRKLAKDCRKLVDYAHRSVSHIITHISNGIPLTPSCRSESPVTQIQAFKSLVRLVTHYPSLRQTFSRNCCEKCEDKEHSTSMFTITGLWTRSDRDCSLEWDFYRGFAAACVLGNEISRTVESIEPSKLGCANEHSLGVIEILLIICR